MPAFLVSAFSSSAGRTGIHPWWFYRPAQHLHNPGSCVIILYRVSAKSVIFVHTSLSSSKFHIAQYVEYYIKEE